jgi:hypothetical protein
LGSFGGTTYCAAVALLRRQSGNVMAAARGGSVTDRLLPVERGQAENAADVSAKRALALA